MPPFPWISAISSQRPPLSLRTKWVLAQICSSGQLGLESTTWPWKVATPTTRASRQHERWYPGWGRHHRDTVWKMRSRERRICLARSHFDMVPALVKCITNDHSYGISSSVYNKTYVYKCVCIVYACECLYVCVRVCVCETVCKRVSVCVCVSVWVKYMCDSVCKCVCMCACGHIQVLVYL